MAKKKKAAKKAAKEATRNTKKKGPMAKKTSRQDPHEHDSHNHEEITLDPTEDKALDLVESSEDIRIQLEDQVTAAAVAAVRKVFEDNGIKLTEAQASNVTFVLFG